MISRRSFLGGVVGLGGAAALGGTGLLSGCAAGTSGNDGGFAGIPVQPPLAKPTTVLLDLHGAPYDMAARTAGALSLLLFGYTSCPDVCPRHLGILADTLADLTGPASRTNVIFVGVDTARDTPERMTGYLAHFDKDFIGLTGEPSAIAAAMTELRLPAVTFDTPDSHGDYTVGHPSQILAFSPDNLAHLAYPFGTRQQSWATDLPRLAARDWTAS